MNAIVAEIRALVWYLRFLFPVLWTPWRIYSDKWNGKYWLYINKNEQN